jgi:hypothetical protein
MAWIRKAPSGKWQARWRDPAGVQRVKTFRLKADAERFLTATEDAMHRGAYRDPNAGRETFGAFWNGECEGARRTGRLSERTLIAYAEIVRLYLAPLVERPLNSITRADVEDVIRGRTRASDIHKVLRAILSRAVKAGSSRRIPRSASTLRAARTPSRERSPGRSSTAWSMPCPTAIARSSSSPPTRRCGGRSLWRCGSIVWTSCAT